MASLYLPCCPASILSMSSPLHVLVYSKDKYKYTIVTFVAQWVVSGIAKVDIHITFYFNNVAGLRRHYIHLYKDRFYGNRNLVVSRRPTRRCSETYCCSISLENILATSVIVNSAVLSSENLGKIVFPVITDQKNLKRHALMVCPKSCVSCYCSSKRYQFDWLTRSDVAVLEVVENHNEKRNYYHGNHTAGTSLGDATTTFQNFASKLQVRNPKFISLLNHLHVYLPKAFPLLDKVVFLDDDLVIQRDLSALWKLYLNGKVNGAAETRRGDDKWVMFKRFSNYFNFSHPLIADNLDPDECAWAYGMNVFDLKTWRQTEIRDTSLLA